MRIKHAWMKLRPFAGIKLSRALSEQTADYTMPGLTSRYYESEHDLLDMQSLLMAGRTQTDDWRYPHVGDLLWWFFIVVCHLDPREHIRLWHAGEKLVGYAILGEDPSFDIQVLPAYTWRGIEEEALVWAEKRIGTLCKSDAQLWGGPIVSGARQDDPRRIEFLEQHGFHVGGQFSEVNMLCTLDRRLPEFTLPAGCQVRSMSEANPGEIAERAAAHREVWQPWTVGNVSNEAYAQFMRLPGFEQELDIVAVAPDGVIAAYVNGWIGPAEQYR
jgi:GNAT superfamily N-acetyltransferase